MSTSLSMKLPASQQTSRSFLCQLARFRNLVFYPVSIFLMFYLFVSFFKIFFSVCLAVYTIIHYVSLSGRLFLQ